MRVSPLKLLDLVVLSSETFFSMLGTNREGIWVGWTGLEDARLTESIFCGVLALQTLSYIHRHTVEAGKVQAGLKAGPCSSFPPPSLPPPFRCYIPFSEWSVSTGSAQDEMSYLRLILIS